MGGSKKETFHSKGKDIFWKNTTLAIGSAFISLVLLQSILIFIYSTHIFLINNFS